MIKNKNLGNEIRGKYGLSINEFARALDDEELFKKVFLLPNLKPDKILKEIEGELEQAKEFKEFGCPYSENELKKAIQRINNL